MIFKPEFTKKMKKSVLREELGYKLQISYFTINRWLDKPKKNELANPDYLKTLMEVSGMSKEEIFSKETV